MTTNQAIQIKEQYDLYDRNFRTAKAKGDFKKASDWKAKRDNLYPRLLEAIEILKN